MDTDLKLSEWRKLRGVTKFMLQKMQTEGTAPKVLTLGPRTRIVTREADREWREAHTAPLSTPEESRDFGRRMQSHKGREAAAAQKS